MKRLDSETRKRINDRLLEVLHNPIEASDHLVNRGAERKIRVGSLRILFTIESGQIVIDTILPRGDVYKHSRR